MVYTDPLGLTAIAVPQGPDGAGGQIKEPVEPWGGAYLTFAPSPWWAVPWKTAKFPKVVGGALKGLTVPSEAYIECNCLVGRCYYKEWINCPNNKRWLLCEVKMTIDSIMINSDEEIVPVADRYWVFGHEQLHVRNFQQIARDTVRLLQVETQKLGCMGPDVCEKEKARLLESSTRFMQDKMELEQAHKLYKHPEAGAFYPVIKGVNKNKAKAMSQKDFADSVPSSGHIEAPAIKIGN
jgi:hypothetical protein